jgi:hypothetical protein
MRPRLLPRMSGPGGGHAALGHGVCPPGGGSPCFTRPRAYSSRRPSSCIRSSREKPSSVSISQSAGVSPPAEIERADGVRRFHRGGMLPMVAPNIHGGGSGSVAPALLHVVLVGIAKEGLQLQARIGEVNTVPRAVHRGGPSPYHPSCAVRQPSRGVQCRPCSERSTGHRA